MAGFSGGVVHSSGSCDQSGNPRLVPAGLLQAKQKCQTPNSGYCQLYPGECAANGMFSIQLPIRFTSSRYVSRPDSVGVKAPANWRRLTVTHSDTQQTETVEVRISGLGSRYVLSHPATQLVGGSTAIEGHTGCGPLAIGYRGSLCLVSTVASALTVPSTFVFSGKQSKRDSVASLRLR